MSEMSELFSSFGLCLSALATSVAKQDSINADKLLHDFESDVARMQGNEASNTLEQMRVVVSKAIMRGSK